MFDRVKTITIVNTQGYGARPFKGVLKLTRETIKYDLKDDDKYFSPDYIQPPFIPDDEIIVEPKNKDVHWSHRLTSDKEKEALNKIFSLAEHLDVDEQVDVLDGQSVVFEILFESGRKDLYCKFIGEKIEPYDKDLRLLSSLILELIPKNKEIPCYLMHQEAADLNEWKLGSYIGILETYKNKKLDVYLKSELLQTFSDCFEPDYNFKENIKSLKDKKIDDMSFDEIRTFITYILEKEKESGNVIDYHFANGNIEALIKHSIYLYEQEWESWDDEEE